MKRTTFDIITTKLNYWFSNVEEDLQNGIITPYEAQELRTELLTGKEILNMVVELEGIEKE